MLKYSWVPNRRKAERRFEFDKRRQLVIHVRNETLSVIVMCVCNPDHSSIGIIRRDAVPIPTGFVMKIEFSD